MRVDESCFVETDAFCDYVPGLSTVSNLFGLFQKSVGDCLSSTSPKNHYWTHIQNKSVFRCILLLFPLIGNLIVLIIDYITYQNSKQNSVKDSTSDKELQSTLTKNLGLLSRQINKGKKAINPCKPASAEEQKLWAACLSNQIEVARDLLNAGISPNFYHLGTTPLTAACQIGSVEMIDLLLKKEAQPNQENAFGLTPFMIACSEGNLACVKQLRPYIEDVDTPEIEGITPLILACARGDPSVVEFLIDQGANSRKKARDGGDAVTAAMLSKDRVDLLPLVLGKQERIDERRYQTETSVLSPFSIPLRVSNLTPLLYAIIVKAEESALYLIDRSDIQHLDSSLKNALHYAVNNLNILEALLAKCLTFPFVNQKDHKGLTPLHQALEFGASQAALHLLQKGADPFISDQQGKTPFMIAYEKNLQAVLSHIQQSYPSQTSIEMKKLERPIDKEPNDTTPEQPTDNLSTVFSLLENSLSLMKSVLNRNQSIQEPKPRTGMEILFGTLNETTRG